MNRQQSHIDPNTTSRLLENLKLAIDETRLVRMIIGNRDLLQKLETTDGA